MANVNAPLEYVGYVRVSTIGQTTEGISLEAQQAKIRQWALVRGAGEIGMFVDAGVSGRSINRRPGLAKALEVAVVHHATLVVYSFSRLARSTKDALGISERLCRAKAGLVSLTENVDTTNGTGRAFFAMIAVFAQLESDLASERTKMALAHKRSLGQRISRHTPYGYDLVDGKRLVSNPHEYETLNLMKTWRAEGIPYGQICRRLLEAGVKTKLGHEKWEPKTVARIVEAR
jgi:DNA invertase Pin-like site-specific DNA recombinase